MKEEYEKLDRIIFIEEVGITKIGSVKKGERKKQERIIISDNFIDNLSPEMREKLIERLQKNIELKKLEAYECSLSKKGE